MTKYLYVEGYEELRVVEEKETALSITDASAVYKPYTIH